MGKYDDIINYEYSGPKNHIRMDRYKRAGQFAPFAALVGYDEEVKEKARITDKRFEYTEELLNKLNSTLVYLDSIIKDKPHIKIIYFVKDNKKNGGKYMEYSGLLRRIDFINRKIEFVDKFKLDLESIYEISIV